MAFQIVYARAENTALEATGRMVVRDMNLFPEFRAAWEGKAGMWLKAGTDADVEKATKALAKEGYTIFQFPSNERDPLGKARAAVVKTAKAA